MIFESFLFGAEFFLFYFAGSVTPNFTLLCLKESLRIVVEDGG